MKYQITQKIMALGGDYSACDESGRELYYFNGKVFNFGGKKVSVLDHKRKEVALVAKQLFTFSPSYRIKRDGVYVATVRKRPFTFREQFIIDIRGAGALTIIGDFIGHEYTIKRGSKDVARVSKRFFGATDSYGVEIQSSDPLLILCAVVVIDMELYKKLKS